MKSIIVPKEFFRNERNNIYGNWRTAFWRELLSNSLDAGAGRIHIRTRFSEDRLMVDFMDDGRGMDRDTIENVYMRLGASTKVGDDGSVGGFGRARILTCFGQDSYTIRTRNLYVRGDGAQYSIDETDRTATGTALVIGIDDNRPEALQRALLNVLKQSSIRSAVTLDLVTSRPCGSEMPVIDLAQAPREETTGRQRFRDWSRKGRAFGELADESGVWGRLHVNGGAHALKGRAIIRVSGMAMYDEHISENLQVTVDLDAARAREVLTASRDSIRPAFRDELQKVFNKISADRTSTFREKAAEPITELSMSAGNAALIRKRGAGNRVVPEQFSRQPAKPIQATPTQPTQDAAPPEQAGANHGRRPSILPPDAGAPDAPQVLVMNTLRLNVATHVENPNSAQKAARRRFDPTLWAGPGSEGRTAELMHAAWHAACRHALETLAALRPEIQDQQWVAGFVFDTGYIGLHREVANVRHGLFLNPVDEAGRMRYQLSEPASMKRMIAVAVHEACHVVHDWHDEQYAFLLTQMMGEIRDKDIEADIRSELREARTWIDRRMAAYEGRFDDLPTPAQDSPDVPETHPEEVRPLRNTLEPAPAP